MSIGGVIVAGLRTDRIKRFIEFNIKPGLRRIGNEQAVPFEPAHHALDQPIEQGLQLRLVGC